MSVYLVICDKCGTILRGERVKALKAAEEHQELNDDHFVEVKSIGGF